tara:strand:+ start:1019 stop:2452 length:1434 start_codon:yes stop_codon:yes gene_type:complete
MNQRIFKTKVLSVKTKYIATTLISLVIFFIWFEFERNINLSKAELSTKIGSISSHSLFRKILTGILILSPPFLLFIYSRSKLLTKYVIQEFCLPFIFCLTGFIAIWLIIDLSDNGADLASAGANIIGYFKYYLVQSPQIIVTIIPISILLSILYSLGRLSRCNEIMSMQGAGKSYFKILSPILFISAYISLISLSLNYQWAPEAEAQKETVLSSFIRGEEYAKNKEYKINSKLYKNKLDSRTWFIGAMPSNLHSGKLRNVEIFQTETTGKIAEVYYAETAHWSKEARSWSLRNGMRISFGNSSEKIKQEPFNDLKLNNWRETPWKIYTDSLIPDQLGIINLIYHLKRNPEKTQKTMAPFKTHLHYRWALPLSCIAIALIACPIGITNSRSNLKGSGTIALIIYFIVIMLNNLFLALGQGMRISPFLGAWSTNIILIISGILLFRFKEKQIEIQVLSIIKLLQSSIKKLIKKPLEQTR